MPQRSNDFQKLVKLIESQLALEGAVITESKMLPDKRTGIGREVDIVIETKVGGHPIVIAVECRDHTRRCDNTWIDQLVGKYQFLSVHKIIAVSKSGFYETAITAAKESNIEPLSFEEAFEADWVQAVNAQNEMYFTAVRFSLEYVGVNITAKSASQKLPTLFVHEPSGKRVMEVQRYGEFLVKTPNHLSARMYQELIDKYDDKRGCFKNGGQTAQIIYSPKGGWHITDTAGERYDLKSFTFDFRCVVERFTVQAEKFSYNGAQVATSTKEFPGMKVTISMAESEEKKPTLGIAIKLKGFDDKPQTEEIISTPIPDPKGAVHFTFFKLG